MVKYTGGKMNNGRRANVLYYLIWWLVFSGRHLWAVAGLRGPGDSGARRVCMMLLPLRAFCYQ